jgi:hypothetical protein
MENGTRNEPSAINLTCSIPLCFITMVNHRRINGTQHLYCIKKYVSGGYMFRPFKRPSSDHPLNNISINLKTYELFTA